MKSLMHSRKFWLAVLDAVVTIAVMWVGYLAAPDQVELIVATILAIQAPFVVLINSIKAEDVAKIKAGAHPTQQE
jgi:hypothetical protein